MNLDIQHFKGLLEEEKKKLETELNGLGKRDGINGATWQASEKENYDPADQEDVASALESYDNAEDTIAVLETQLREVNHALDKIEQGTYGTCETSGDMIETDRLEANPSARTCKAHMNEQ